MGTSLEKDIKKSLEEEDHGIFFVMLKPDYKFLQNRDLGIMVFEGENEPWDERMMSGTFRHARQLTDEYFDLEYVHERHVSIPYESIESYERLRDLPKGF
ncbi:hypothetical protein GOV06_03105 [Candidatus Woesearchaeota archaeon]|nr:hypothetical protein [Candidatus Woesearchaeota archaeon]